MCVCVVCVFILFFFPHPYSPMHCLTWLVSPSLFRQAAPIMRAGFVRQCVYRGVSDSLLCCCGCLRPTLLPFSMCSRAVRLSIHASSPHFFLRFYSSLARLHAHTRTHMVEGFMCTLTCPHSHVSYRRVFPPSLSPSLVSAVGSSRHVRLTIYTEGRPVCSAQAYA